MGEKGDEKGGERDKKVEGKRARVEVTTTIESKPPGGPKEAVAEETESQEFGPAVVAPCVEVGAGSEVLVNTGNYENIRVVARVDMPLPIVLTPELKREIRERLEEVYGLANAFVFEKVDRIRERLGVK